MERKEEFTAGNLIDAVVTLLRLPGKVPQELYNYKPTLPAPYLTSVDLTRSLRSPQRIGRSSFKAKVNFSRLLEYYLPLVLRLV